MTATALFQHALFENAPALADAGVYLPMAGRSELSPRGVSHHHLGWELAGNPMYRQAAGGWDALSREIADVEDETILISSEILGWIIPIDGVPERLGDRLLSLGRSVTIVYVVRDQLSLINSSYAQEVKQLQDMPPFRRHVAGVLARGDADLERLTRHWYNSPDFQFVAVPFTALDGANPLVALLQAAGIDIDVKTLNVTEEPISTSLGPTAIEAFRLLRSYLRALNPGISGNDTAVRRLYRIAARRAKEEGWCKEAFWGWPPPLAARAAEQLAPSNERFAQAVWGTPWPMPLPVDRPQARAQLLKLPVAELDRVHEFVVAMAKRYATLRSGANKG